MARTSPSRTRRAWAIALLGLMVPLVGAPASADTRPPDPTEPVTVSADPLPTVQVDGVVWSQVVVGRTVYAAGSFTTARPAGAAPGQRTAARANLLAYDLRTGELDTSFAPRTNAQVYAITASPDGSRLYIGGDFTQVDGVSVWRVAALDRATGALVTSFLPRPDYRVRALVATADTVYLGGGFNAVGRTARARLAAVRAGDGALLPWNPRANSGVHALALSPDGSRLVVGGAFTTLNGSSSPGYGLGAVSPSTGESLPFAVNALIRNGGTNGAITSLSGDQDLVYGSGYTVGREGGTLEGSFAATWAGALRWVEDCHGDTYSVWPRDDVVYQASHKHYCGNIGGFPQTVPWPYRHGTVVTKDVAGTATREQFGYTNYQGQPVPAMLPWYPEFTPGTYTGMNQGPWHVTGAGDYVVMGGEFRAVNGTPQQGLVRFAVPAVAPHRVGPTLSGGRVDLDGHSPASGTVRVQWTANHDHDNRELTYRLVRNSTTTVHVVTQRSTWFQRPPMGFLDTGLAPGSTQRYRLQVTDPYGNAVWSDSIDVIVGATTPPASEYAALVAAHGASSHWRLGEPSGARAQDAVGWNDMTVQPGVTRGTPGALADGRDTAFTFDGTSGEYASTRTHQRVGDVLSLEVWFRTTTGRGGKLLGFGDAATGRSILLDRHLYLDDQGRVLFGVRPAAALVVTSPRAYGDGQWHHAVGTLSATGMRLYVDGVLVASRSDVVGAAPTDGYWRVGGDTLTGWSSEPSSHWYAGALDEVAVYPRALTAAEVAEHHAVGRGAEQAGPLAADAFGRTVSGGWGSADVGGAWGTVGSPSRFAVSGGTGNLSLQPGTGASAYLPVSTTSADLTATVTLDRAPGGSGAYVSLTTRRVGAAEYRTKVRVAGDGSVGLQHTRVVGGSETTLASATVPARHVPGTGLMVRTQAVGTGPTLLVSSVRVVGASDPGWQLTGQDAAAALQAPGGVGVVGHLSSGSAVPVVLRLDDLVVRTAG